MQASLDLKTQNIIPITPRHFTLHYSVYTLKPSKYQNQFFKTTQIHSRGINFTRLFGIIYLNTNLLI